jgi:hypothetical protein
VHLRKRLATVPRMALLDVLFSRRLKYSFSSTTTHKAEKAADVGRGKIHISRCANLKYPQIFLVFI